MFYWSLYFLNISKPYFYFYNTLPKTYSNNLAGGNNAYRFVQDLTLKSKMILITYIKPSVVINSDKLISGTLNIIDSNNTIAMTKIFKSKTYFNIEVKKDFGDIITVVLETKQKEYKKRITINKK